MALASDLLGLGLNPFLAGHLASGGNGPLTIAAAGSTFATATKLQAEQFVCSCINADGTKGVALPTVGGDSGALLADDYVINNAGSTSLQIFSSSGVVISTGGSNTSSTQVQLHTTMTLYPISTTQWIAVKGS